MLPRFEGRVAVDIIDMFAMTDFAMTDVLKCGFDAFCGSDLAFGFRSGDSRYGVKARPAYATFLSSINK